MQNIKLILGITALVSLLATIIATPAMAAPRLAPGDTVRTKAIVMPWGTVIMPQETIKPCKVRVLDQGSGSVRICG